jgi:hypothetical protein
MDLSGPGIDVKLKKRKEKKRWFFLKIVNPFYLGRP